MPCSKFQPALYGGLLLGVLSALPIVKLGQRLLLSLGASPAARWPPTCSRTARRSPDHAGRRRGRRPAGRRDRRGRPAGPVDPGQPRDGAAPGRMSSGSSRTRDMPENMRPIIDALRRTPASASWARFSASSSFLFLAMIFSTLGGLLGAALFRKKGIAVLPRISRRHPHRRPLRTGSRAARAATVPAPSDVLMVPLQAAFDGAQGVPSRVEGREGCLSDATD